MNLPDFNLDVLRGPLDCSHPDVVALINQGESDPEGFLHALTRLVIKDNPQKYDLYTLLTQAIAGGASGPDTVGESAPSGSEGSISRWLFSLGRGKNKNEQALLSWGELREDIHRRMDVLAKQGVKPGDVVVLMGLGINSLLASVLAVLRLGGAFSVLSMQPSFTFQARKAALLALTQAPSSNPSHSCLSHSNLACLSSNHLSPCHSTIKRCFFLTETRLESASGNVLAHLPEKPEATLSTLADNRPFAYNSTDNVCISFDEESEQGVKPWVLSAKTWLQSLLLNGLCFIGTAHLQERNLQEKHLKENQASPPKLWISPTCDDHYLPSICFSSLLFGVLPQRATYPLLPDVGMPHLFLQDSNQKNYVFLMDDWHNTAPLSENTQQALTHNDTVPVALISRLRFSSVIQGVSLIGKLKTLGSLGLVYPVPGRAFSQKNALINTQDMRNGQGLMTFKLANNHEYISPDLLFKTGNGYLYQEWSLHKLPQAKASESVLTSRAPYPAEAIQTYLKRYLKAYYWQGEQLSENAMPPRFWADFHFVPAHLESDNQVTLLVFFLSAFTPQRVQRDPQTGHALLQVVESCFEQPNLKPYKPTSLRVFHYCPSQSRVREPLSSMALEGFIEKESHRAFYFISVLRKKCQDLPF